MDDPGLHRVRSTPRRTTQFTFDPPTLDVATFREVAAETGAAPSLEEALATRIRVLHPGGEAEPQLIEISMDPGLRVRPHAHDVDEIFYVLDGEMSFGRQRCISGTSISIPARTLYGFVVGADGVRFLNFRGSTDSSYLTRAGA